jgi:hypothetical protein
MSMSRGVSNFEKIRSLAMDTTTCVIWGTPAHQRARTGDFRVIQSPRAGGWYIVTGSVESSIAAASVPQKRAITRWLLRQRSFGILEPRLDSHTSKLAAQQPPLSFTEKVNSAIQHFGTHIDRMDSGFKITLGGQTTADPVNELIAASDSVDLNDLSAFLGILKKMQLLTSNDNINASIFSLTPTGWERFDTLNTKVVASHQAFVAMWFSPIMLETYTDGFAPAITTSGYKPFRIDKKEHVNKIDDEIIAEIRRSRFLVSDFTCEPEKPRGGVYFEAGFAMGIGIPVIWTCKDTSINDLHFDTRQYNHIVWKDAGGLHKQLHARIGAVIGDGPLKERTGA